MKHVLRPLILRPLCLALVCIAASLIGTGQEPPTGEHPPAFGSFDDFGQIGSLQGFGADSTRGQLTLSGKLKVEQGGRRGQLQITAELTPGWHTYALDQKGGPGPGEITVKAEGLKLAGPFKPDRPPEVRSVEYFEVPLREHYDRVIWSAPVELDERADPASMKIEATFNGQICEDSAGCQPIFDRPIPIEFAGYYTPEPQANEFRADRSHVTVKGTIHPAVVQPGSTLHLALTAECDEGWHVYAWAEKDPHETAKPTLIVLDSPPGWTAEPAEASSEPVEKELLRGEPPVRYHDGEVTWTVPIPVPPDTPPGEVSLGGIIGYQACTENSCDRPLGARFSAEVTVGENLSDENISLTFAAASYTEASKLAVAKPSSADPSPEESAGSGTVMVTGDATSHDAAPGETASSESDAEPPPRPAIDFWGEMYKRLHFEQVDDGWRHPWLGETVLHAASLKVAAVLIALVVSFMGGLILNIMPCVLPVIGLKLMSFVRQAGEDRWRIFSLNVWYAVGIWAVFMLFAVVAAVLHLLGGTLSWGEHMGDPRISIPLLLLIFTLALSLFGVWEIMLPGFVGTGATNELAQKEGIAGALFKGVLTTILATPCSGPFIGVAIGIAVIAPYWLNFTMFAAMGLGMASPYLLIGTFPRLINWLPKPGEWMETFKQLMGFVLMGTSVWILSVLESRFIIPVLSLMVGVGAACWIVGRTPYGVNLSRRIRNWIWAAVFVAAGVLVFSLLLSPPVDVVSGSPRPSDDSPELPWEMYTPDLLQSYRDKQATVMVDFTADW